MSSQRTNWYPVTLNSTQLRAMPPCASHVSFPDRPAATCQTYRRAVAVHEAVARGIVHVTNNGVGGNHDAGEQREGDANPACANGQIRASVSVSCTRLLHMSAGLSTPQTSRQDIPT